MVDVVIVVAVVAVVVDGGRSSVVKASEFESEDPGFDRLAGQCKRQFFCPSESTVVLTCLCLTPLRVYGTHPKCVHTLKIAYLSVVKE